MSVSKRLPATQLINGDVCSVYHNPSHYLQALEFAPETGDIIQVTYPRTGSHLVQQLIQLIVNRGRSARTFQEFTRRAPFLEIHGLPDMPDKEAPRLLRTHLAMNRLRLSEKAKYIYVARNPWDCCMSLFLYLRNWPGFKFNDACFDDFVDVFLEGQSGFGDYFDHVISGFEHRLDENVFFVTYEEIHRNKADVVVRLADFLGGGYGDMVRGNREALELILEKSSIEFMRNLLETHQGGMNQVFRGGNVSNKSVSEENSATSTVKLNLVRKGAVFEGRSYFSPENAVKMKNRIDAKFGGTDIMTLWKREEIVERL